MQCYTQEEIANEVGCDPTDKNLRVSGNLEDLPIDQKSSAEVMRSFIRSLKYRDTEENNSNALPSQ